MQEPVPGEAEGVDLDLCFLARIDETDVAVRHHRFNLEMTVDRHDNGKRLCWSDDPAYRMHRQLLYYAVNRRGKQLELGSSLCLDDVLRQTASFLLGLCQLIEKGAAVFRLNLCPGFGESCHRSISIAVTALLDKKILLLANEVLKLGEVLEFRTQFLISEVLADIDALLKQWNRRVKLCDRGGDGGSLGFFLRPLTLDLGKLGILLGTLTEQKLALHPDQRRARAVRRMEVFKWIGVPGQRRAQSCNFKLRSHEVTF